MTITIGPANNERDLIQNTFSSIIRREEQDIHAYHASRSRTRHSCLSRVEKNKTFMRITRREEQDIQAYHASRSRTIQK